MEPKIITANKGLRIWFYLGVLIMIALVGYFNLRIFPPIKAGLASGNVSQAEVIRLARLMEIILVCCMALPVLLGIRMLRIGGKAVEHLEFPPPGTSVIRDTVVIEGDSARKRGYATILVALMLIFFGLSSAWLTHKLVMTIIGRANGA